jgi:hypothetical protein
LTKAQDKIGENYNHTSKNKTLFHLLNRCLIEFSKSLATMRGLQESILVSDHKYRVTFLEEEEAEPFQKLRDKLAKLIKNSAKLDFRAETNLVDYEIPEEHDQSYEDQLQDNSYIGDLIPRKTETDLATSKNDIKHTGSDANIPVSGRHTLIMDGTRRSKPDLITTIKSAQRLAKSSASNLGSRKQSMKVSNSQLLKNQASLVGLRSNKQLSVSSSKQKPADLHIEDAEMFASNLKHAPQRMVQRRTIGLP